MDKTLKLFHQLLNIMKRLRIECPWDRKQTPESLRDYILEEAYETVEAIDDGNWDDVRKELGDLLLQIVFQGEIAEEEGRFTVADIIQSINDKLIVRHPHVFGDVSVASAEEVADNWETIKKNTEKRTSIMEGIPVHLSALLRAEKVQKKAAKVGFDWEQEKDVAAKVFEEIEEFLEIDPVLNPEKLEEEFGDILFALVNVARWKRISPEHALRKTTNKFIARFKYIEYQLAETGKSPSDCSLDELEALWNQAKSKGL